MKMEKRKYFGTDGIRGKANQYPMVPELILQLGKALGYVIRNKTKNNNNSNKIKLKIIIGKDTRTSGYMFEAALQAGIVSSGVDVLLVGPLPTPAIAHLTKSMNADAGIMISASHNPANDNGIKIFDSEGFKLPDKMEYEIEKIMDNLKYNSKYIGKAKRIDEAMGRYIEFAKASINSNSLRGMKIVIDCANGAAYHVAPKIFEELGAEIITINNKPEGYNINLNCGAQFPKNLSKTVKKEKAHLGIALDGDADRIILIDEKGNILSGDHILALLSLQFKKENKLKNNKIAITVMSNYGLKKYLEKHKIDYIETKVGDKYVIEEIKRNKLNLGGEQSGHIIMSDYTTTGDGIICGLHIANILKNTKIKLSELSKIIKLYPQILINIKVKNKPDINSLNSYKIIKKYEQEINGKGRILVRYSGTENLCRVMVEHINIKKTKEIAQKISNEIKKEIGI
ncbi:MAG: phosphoglucosamine mutase [Candidatus Woesearchaeota archaeon]